MDHDKRDGRRATGDAPGSDQLEICPFCARDFVEPVSWEQALQLPSEEEVDPDEQDRCHGATLALSGAGP